MVAHRQTAIILLAALWISAPVFAQNVEWHVSTDQAVYATGEPVVFSMEACNTGATTTVVDLNVAPLVVDSSGEAVFAFTLLPWVNDVEIPPNECRSATDQGWNQSDNMGSVVTDQVAPGWYNGDLDGTTSVPFEIRQVAAVPISPGASLCFALLLAIFGAGIVRRLSS